MRMIIKHISFWLAGIFLCGTQGIVAQDSESNNENRLPIRVVEEKIVLTADRNLYIAGENIQFGAEYLTRRPLEDISWSTVLYVELVNTQGESAAQSKYPLDDQGALGVVMIPKDLMTGVYYLKAYTKWMRNYPVSRYAYYPLKIVNPYETSLAPEGEIAAGEERVIFNDPEKDPDIKLHTDKSTYKTNEKVEVSLAREYEADPDYYYDLSYVYSVSVARKGTRSISASSDGWTSREEIMGNTAQYLPEINGICFSGKVSDQEGRPAADAEVSLCLLNNQTYFSKAMTNERGEFFFRLPDSEEAHDFFIDAEKDGKSLSVQIDNDFCQRPVYFGENNFKLSEQEKLLAAELAVNAQLTERYVNFYLPMEDEDNDLPLQFYGSPNRVVYTKDYINLPNVGEFLFEIIPEIRVNREEGKPVIKPSVWNVYHNFPFLVMLDNIPVWDIEDFLNLKTNKIERFELIDNSYVIGDAKFCGILSAFSRNQDIAGLDLPRNSQFYRYNMFTDREENSIIQEGSRIPDRRNCLYWNPRFELDKSQKQQFSFTTSDIKGSYEIIVTQIDRRDGSVRWAVADFEVE